MPSVYKKVAGFEKRPKLKWLLENVGHHGDDCLIFPFVLAQNGYGYFLAGNRSHSAHRFMCEKRNGPPPTSKHHAAHNCGNGERGCVNPCHLEWKTNSQNQLDRKAHGTDRHGKGSRWKLTPEQVAEIRACKDVEPVASLARRFGIKDATIRQIHTYRIWRTGERTTGGFTKARP